MHLLKTRQCVPAHRHQLTSLKSCGMSSVRNSPHSSVKDSTATRSLIWWGPNIVSRSLVLCIPCSLHRVWWTDTCVTSLNLTLKCIQQNHKIISLHPYKQHCWHFTIQNKLIRVLLCAVTLDAWDNRVNTPEAQVTNDTCPQLCCLSSSCHLFTYDGCLPIGRLAIKGWSCMSHH